MLVGIVASYGLWGVGCWWESGLGLGWLVGIGGLGHCGWGNRRPMWLWWESSALVAFAALCGLFRNPAF